MTSWNEQTFTNAPALHIEIEPQPVPAPGRPDEFWWVEWCEGMPLEPARIEFEGDAPAKILQLGDDSSGTPLEEVPHIKLVERILPPGRVAEVADAIEGVLCSPGEDLKNEAARDALWVLRGEPAKEA